MTSPSEAVRMIDVLEAANGLRAHHEEQLRALCDVLDRIREAAGVGPETEIEDLIAVIRELARRQPNWPIP